MEDKLFELLGLGVPFYLGAATYGVFAWLDSNASDDATKVISSWLHGRSQNKPDLGNLIINTFDRIYTSPLLRFRAFRRSAAISLIMWFFGVVVLWFAGFGLGASLGFVGIGVILLLTVLSDYVSLLFVRHFLNSARIYPMRASALSSVVGLLVVGINFVVLITITITITLSLTGAFGFSGLQDIYYAMYATLQDVFDPDVAPTIAAFLKFMMPALIIHLWLPLFALSSLAVRLLYPLFRAVEKAQWFLKQGDAHPLKAIGIVSTIIVFGSAMLVKEAWAVL
jgi:hypothetical protein